MVGLGFGGIAGYLMSVVVLEVILGCYVFDVGFSLHRLPRVASDAINICLIALIAFPIEAFFGLAGGLLGASMKRRDLGLALRGLTGLLTSYGFPWKIRFIAGAVLWASGAAGGWFGANRILSGKGGIPLKPNFRESITLAVIIALHAGVFVLLIRQD